MMYRDNKKYHTKIMTFSRRSSRVVTHHDLSCPPSGITRSNSSSAVALRWALTLSRLNNQVASGMVIKERTIQASRMPICFAMSFLVSKMI